MKIRSGFVTNSSSSSFIVSFDEFPNSKENVQQILFGDQKYWTKYDYTAECSVIAEKIYNDMIDKESSTENDICLKYADIWDIARELAGGGHDDAPSIYKDSDSYYNFNDMYNPKYIKGKTTHIRTDGSTYETSDIDWDVYRKDTYEWAFKKAQEFYEENDNRYIFIFNYGDENGPIECVMEHGDIFEALGNDKVIRISHH